MGGSDCPTWCASNHCREDTFSPGEDEVGELLHATAPTPIPVVVLLQTFEGDRVMEAETLDVILFQHQFLGTHQVEAQEEWVFIGNDHGALTLTRESANRVYRLLGKVLAAGT